MENKMVQQESLSKPLDDIIPTPDSRLGRTLVLCFDGTGDQFDLDNSNVVQFFSMLVKDNPTQLVYYQSGIGTYTIPQIVRPLKAKIRKIVDMMIGIHIDAHIMSGYEFLMQNYKAGDKICLFGFSRGAYTARALAGMVTKIGIIPVGNLQEVPFAYNMYSRHDDDGWASSNAFKRTFSIKDVNIEFIGVWDTVNAVGIPPKILPFTRANCGIKYFRHALSLDERRVLFKPSRFQCMSKEEMGKLGITPPNVETNVESVWFAGDHCDVGGGNDKNNTRNSLARIPLRWMVRECFKNNIGILFHRHTFKYIGMDPATLYPPVLKRVDIINSSGKDDNSPTHGGLGKGSWWSWWFWWFPKQILTAVLNWFTYLFLTSRGNTTPTPDESVKDLSKEDPEKIFFDFVNEEAEDNADAISKAHDQLESESWLTWLWWFLEMIPQPVFYQYDDCDEMVYMINKGDGRDVSYNSLAHTLKKGSWWSWFGLRTMERKTNEKGGRDLSREQENIKVHRSVKIRMDKYSDGGKKYVPKARVDLVKDGDKVDWIDGLPRKTTSL